MIAADRREFAGLEPRFNRATALDWGLDYARRAEHRGRQWLLVANGPGPRLAAEAFDAAIARAPVNRVMSTGFCGAVDPALEVGDVIAVNRVLDLASGTAYDTDVPRAARRLPTGALACQDRVITSAEEKAAIRRETGAIAVDMESSAVAARSVARGIPWQAVRVVSDRASESFSLDFNRARDPQGRFRMVTIVQIALRRPMQRVPELLRLARHTKAAADALGEFLSGDEA